MRFELSAPRMAILVALMLVALPIAASAQTGVLYVEGDKVGIGTDAPSQIFHIKSTAPGNTFAFIQNTSGPERVGSRFQNSLATWDFRMDSVGDFIFDNAATVGEDLKIKQNGQLRVGPAPAKIILQPTGDIDIQGTLTEGSSRTFKHAFQTLDPTNVLDKVSGLDVVEWSYKNQSTRHIGPMAEDFHALFGLGNNNKALAPRDLAGVTLLAVQGLHQEVEKRDAQIEDLQRQVAELKSMVEALSEKSPK